MWTWLPQSWADWVLLLCLSVASLFAVYEMTSLHSKKKLMRSTGTSVFSSTVTGVNGSKTTTIKTKVIR